MPNSYFNSSCSVVPSFYNCSKLLPIFPEWKAPDFFFYWIKYFNY